MSWSLPGAQSTRTQMCLHLPSVGGLLPVWLTFGSSNATCPPFRNNQEVDKNVKQIFSTLDVHLGTFIRERRWPHPIHTHCRSGGPTGVRKVSGPPSGSEQHLLPPARPDNLVTPGCCAEQTEGLVSVGYNLPWICLKSRRRPERTTVSGGPRTKAKPGAQVSICRKRNARCLATNEKLTCRNPKQKLHAKLPCQKAEKTYS